MKGVLLTALLLAATAAGAVAQLDAVATNSSILDTWRPEAPFRR